MATPVSGKGGKRAAKPAGPADRGSATAGPFLEKALARHWKALRKRLTRELPRHRTGTDEAVHDMRTASRQVLSILAAAEAWGPRKAVGRLRRRVNCVLDRLGPLRDLTVEREHLARMTSAGPTAALRAFRRSVDLEFRRSARKARRRLARLDEKALRRDVRRIRRRLADTKAPRGTRRDVVKAVALAYSDLQDRRVAVDPTALETVHRMRISLKEFRYLVKAAAPLVPGVSDHALVALHELQTTMGDLHDLEVLSSALAAFAKGDADRTAQLSPVLADLEAQHSALLRSFLRSADATLARWKRSVLVLPSRRATR